MSKPTSKEGRMPRMTPGPGNRIGPYEITASLGEGGMGVVFRARDTQLLRDVALKFLPAGFENAPDRLGRFQREAQVLRGQLRRRTRSRTLVALQTAHDHAFDDW